MHDDRSISNRTIPKRWICLAVALTFPLFLAASQLTSLASFAFRLSRSARYIELDLVPSAAPTLLPEDGEFTPLVSRFTGEQLNAARKVLREHSAKLDDDGTYIIQFDGAKHLSVVVSDRNAKIGLDGFMTNEIIQLLFQLAEASESVVVVEPMTFQGGFKDINDFSDLVAVLPGQHNPSIEARWTRITHVKTSEELINWFRQLKADGSAGNL